MKNCRLRNRRSICQKCPNLGCDIRGEALLVSIQSHIINTILTFISECYIKIYCLQIVTMVFLFPEHHSRDTLIRSIVYGFLFSKKSSILRNYIALLTEWRDSNLNHHFDQSSLRDRFFLLNDLLRAFRPCRCSRCVRRRITVEIYMLLSRYFTWRRYLDLPTFDVVCTTCTIVSIHFRCTVRHFNSALMFPSMVF